MIKEVRRQFVHFLFGSLFIALAILFGTEGALLYVSALFSAGLVAILLILAGIKIPLLYGIVQRLEREQEKGLPGKGALMLFLGAIILMILTQNVLVVVGALCVSAYGDVASTIFGLKWGKHSIVGKKTLEGTLGGIFVSLLFLGVLFEWWIALIAAVAGMLSELLPIDDSITIPLVSAVVLTLLL